MKYLILLLLFILSNTAQTQVLKKNYFSADIKNFKQSSNNVYSEIYLMFSPKPIKQEFVETHFILFTIKDKNGIINYNQIYNCDSLLIGKQESFVDLILIHLIEGDYNIICSALDANKSVLKEIQTIKVTVSEKINNVSDIELCQKIEKSNLRENIFFKNGFELMPNVQSFYDNQTSQIFYYFEIYPGNKDSVFLNLTLSQNLNNEKKIVWSLKKDKLYLNKIQPEVGIIQIQSFDPGKYIFRVEYSDKKGLKDEHSTIVYIGGKELSAEKNRNNENVFSNLNQNEIYNEFNKAKYIATTQEINLFNSLKSTSDKSLFLYRFWVNRSTNENVLYAYYEYLKKIEICNEKYSTTFNEGWKTDRGRVFIIYGEPSDVEIQTSNDESKPYLKWNYDSIEGGIYFIFVDRNGTGNFELMHSTKRGELKDEKWEEHIR